MGEPFLRLTPLSLFGGRTPPFARPLFGAPGVDSVDVNTPGPGAKPSPRQLQPDWQSLGAWRGGPRVGSVAADWPVPESRLCGEFHKESWAEARCSSWGAVEKEVGLEERTCPPWAGGAAGRRGLCGYTRQRAGCTLAELSSPGQ